MIRSEVLKAMLEAIDAAANQHCKYSSTFGSQNLQTADLNIVGDTKASNHYRTHTII